MPIGEIPPPRASREKGEIELGPLPAAGLTKAPEVYPSDAKGDAPAMLNGLEAVCPSKFGDIANMASARGRTVRFIVPP
jgi:hypothetical protein